MGADSKIEWTDATWNPVRGCSRVSPGCGGPGPHGGCYAEIMAARFSKPGQWGHGFAEMKGGDHRWTGKVELVDSMLDLPLRWKKPRRIFVNSTSDLFHPALRDSEIDRVFAIAHLASRHTLQILTKRPDRMQRYFSDVAHRERQINGAIWSFLGTPRGSKIEHGGNWRCRRLPFPNVWLGTSVEDQERADERIPHLMATPAAVRFLSCEPLLGPINLGFNEPCDHVRHSHEETGCWRALSWVIVGGESGPGARPMHPDWTRALRAQCSAADVPFFFKQHGEWLSTRDDNGEISYGRHERHCFGSGGDEEWLYRTGKKRAGRTLDGIEHNAFPLTSHA